MEKLRRIRIGYPADTVEHRLADEEIRRRESEEAKKESQARELLENQRHQELVATQNRTNNRADEHWYKKPLGIIIIAVTGGLLVALIKYVLGI